MPPTVQAVEETERSREVTAHGEPVCHVAGQEVELNAKDAKSLKGFKFVAHRLADTAFFFF